MKLKKIVHTERILMFKDEMSHVAGLKKEGCTVKLKKAAGDCIIADIGMPQKFYDAFMKHTEVWER